MTHTTGIQSEALFFTAANRTARMRRSGVSISLILAAALSIMWVALQPPPGTVAGEGLATLSTFAFTLSQLPFILAVMGIAHVVASRAPVCAAIGGGFAVLGGFGHTVLGGVQLSQIGMTAVAPAPGPLNVLTLLGTVGTVLGLILLAVGLLRARVGPTWAPYALWAFVLVEFAGSGLTAWASLVSGALYLASFVALAVTVWRTRLDVWRSDPA